MHDVAFVNAHLATMSHGDVRDGVLAATGDRISWAGSRKEWRDKARIEHDARGAWITPALIDCHTHLVYAGNRAHEFELRLNGATYEEIARAGGEFSTVKATRAATEDELVAAAQKRLAQWEREGATVIEVKSGYGLDHDTELRMLGAARRPQGLEVRTTFLGAHALPPEYKGRADDYIDLVLRCPRRGQGKALSTRSMHSANASRSRRRRRARVEKRAHSACRSSCTPTSSDQRRGAGGGSSRARPIT